MRRWFVELALLLLLLATSGLGYRRIVTVSRLLDSEPALVARPAAAPIRVDVAPESVLVSWAATVSVRNAFRDSPRLVAAAEAAIEPAPPAPALPALTLHAVAGGPPWSAAVSLRGSSELRVLVLGDTIADAKVTRIRRDSVRVAFRDTSWTLTLSRTHR